MVLCDDNLANKDTQPDGSWCSGVTHSPYGSSAYTSKWVGWPTDAWILAHFCTKTLVYGTLLVFNGVMTKRHKVGQVDHTIKDFLLLLL